MIHKNILNKLILLLILLGFILNPVLAQDVSNLPETISMDSLDFSSARLSLAGPNAFYLRDVTMGESSLAMVFRRDNDGIWKISEIYSDTDSLLPSNIILDFARLETLDNQTVVVNGILIDGRPLSGTFVINPDTSLDAPTSFSGGSFIGTSLERANLDAGLFSSADLDPLRSEIDRLKGELASLNDNYETLEKDLGQAKSDATAAQEALNSAELSLSAESAARVNAEAERDNTQFEKSALEVKITELEALQTSLSSIIEDLEKDKEQLKGDVSELSSENTSLLTENTSLTEEKASLEVLLAASQGQLSSLQSNFTSLQSRNASLEEEIIQLQSELAELKDTNGGTEVIDSETTVDSETQNQWKEEAERLQAEVTQLQSKITDLESQLATVTSENETLKTALSDSQTALSAAQNEAEQARTALQTYLGQQDTTEADTGTGESDIDVGNEAIGSFTVAEIQAMQEQVVELQRQNESLIVQRNELEAEIRESLLSSGIIGLVAKELNSDLTPELVLSGTRIGQWNIEGNVVTQADSQQYFAKLDLPVPQSQNPMLYQFNGQSTGQDWVGFGIHIYASDVEKRGYGYGKSMLLWFTRDPEVYKNQRTYLELYVSEDDINMQRVLNAMIPDDIASGLDIQLLYQPEDQYINVSVNGVERIRYKTWFNLNEGIGVALRSLNSARFSDLQILTKE